MTRTPLKIAVVTTFPPSQQSLNEYGLHLVTHLAQRKDVGEVIVLADKLPVHLSECASPPHKICIQRLWDFNALTTAPRLLIALRRHSPDGVLFNLQMASFGDREVPAALGLLTPMLARAIGVPSGVIAHNILGAVDLEQTVLAGRPWRQALVRTAGSVIMRALLRANYLTTTLQGYLDVLRSIKKSADLSLVPHGTFDTEDRAWRPHANRPRRIVTMGKFGTYKRLDTLLAAFDLLRTAPDLADVELVIGGSDHPNAPGYIMALQDERKDDKGVVFHGYVAEDEVPEFFESARLTVFDYHSTTGSSGVLHQSAGYGAFPIFPHIGDFIDVCRDEGIEGSHYTPGDPQEMAAAIACAIRDPAGTEAIAQANVQAARKTPFSQVTEFHVKKLSALSRHSTSGQWRQ